MAGLLSANPPLVKAEFQRLGVQFEMAPVVDQGRPFLRAVGQTDLSVLLASDDLPTSVPTHPRLNSSRTARFVVDLPPNQLGPGWRDKVAG